MNKKIRTILLLGAIILILASIYIIIIKKQENEDIKVEEEKVTFEISDITANANDEITINIKMIEDASFVAGNFELLYDSEKMEYIKYEKGQILEEAAMSIVNNNESDSKVSIAYVSDPQNETNCIPKGELIKITFKINETVSNTKISPQFECSTLKDKEGNDIKFTINQGTITIK